MHSQVNEFMMKMTMMTIVIMMTIMIMMMMVSQMSCDCYVLGSLPVEIGLLSGVEMLSLYNNQLSREIHDDDRDDDHDDNHVL